MSPLSGQLGPQAAAGVGLASTDRGAAVLLSGADVLIGLALIAIAAALLRYFAGRTRTRGVSPRRIFVALLAVSALSHFMFASLIWSPVPGAETVIKVSSAIIASGAALALWVFMRHHIATSSTAQRAAELAAVQQTLLWSEEQYRVSFEAAAVGKTQTDPRTGIILRANKAFANMLGYEPDEVVGRVGWEFTWPDDRAGHQIEFDRLKAGVIPACIHEKRYLRKDGSPVWGRVSANIVSFPESGQPDRLIAVVEDVDERYRTQAALEIARCDLESVVVERTAALVQRDLLIREVYHRVKNNLQVIDSILVLQRRALSDPAARNALTSLRGRVYALGLVHQQLMGSADLESFDVAPFLRELVGNLVEGAAASGIGLTVSSAPMAVGLDFAIPLGLLVTELVTNSLKHAFPDGRGNIDVVLSRSDDGSIDLIVSDDGTGYVRGAGVLEPSNSHLGETIIQGLVHQLKASITVQNHHGTRSEIRMAKAACATN